MRRLTRSMAVATTTLALTAATVAIISSTPAAAATTRPGQVLLVTAPSATSTTARVERWQLDRYGVYQHVGAAMPGRVGELGVGRTADDIPRTPAGVFGLTQAFGRLPSNGTRLPYFRTTPRDWWNGERNSPNYNRHVVQTAAPGPESENLYYTGAVYDHAVVINYNMNPTVKGAGAAFFLHITNGQPTGGCVALSAADLDTVMRWLDPAQHPVISIGVGAAPGAMIVASHNPYGYLDSVRGGAGRVSVSGWAADPDNRARSVTVHIWIDGHPALATSTRWPRPDVARARATGPNQGYQADVAIGAGRHTVCSYAINWGMGSTNPKLGCSTVTVG